MTWRIRSVRKRILLLALVPLLSLFGLYVVTTSITAQGMPSTWRRGGHAERNATGQPTGTFEGEIQGRAPARGALPWPLRHVRTRPS